jgi:hypothetical protein
MFPSRGIPASTGSPGRYLVAGTDALVVTLVQLNELPFLLRPSRG